MSLSPVSYTHLDVYKRQLVKYLEFAMSEAKRRGKNGLVEFSKNDYDAYVSRLEIKEELRKSIFNNYEGFTLYLSLIHI